MVTTEPVSVIVESVTDDGPENLATRFVEPEPVTPDAPADVIQDMPEPVEDNTDPANPI